MKCFSFFGCEDTWCQSPMRPSHSPAADCIPRPYVNHFLFNGITAYFLKAFLQRRQKIWAGRKVCDRSPNYPQKIFKKKKSNVCKVSLSAYRSNFNVGQHSQSRFGILLIRSKKKRSCFPLVLVSNVFPNVPTHSPFCLLVFWCVRAYTCPFFNYYSGTLFKYS